MKNLAIKYLRDNNLLTTTRMFIGKDRSENSIIQMMDEKGRIRLQFLVTQTGDAKIEFLNEDGKPQLLLSPTQNLDE